MKFHNCGIEPSERRRRFGRCAGFDSTVGSGEPRPSAVGRVPAGASAAAGPDPVFLRTQEAAAWPPVAAIEVDIAEGRAEIAAQRPAVVRQVAPERAALGIARADLDGTLALHRHSAHPAGFRAARRAPTLPVHAGLNLARVARGIARLRLLRLLPLAFALALLGRSLDEPEQTERAAEGRGQGTAARAGQF